MSLRDQFDSMRARVTEGWQGLGDRDRRALTLLLVVFLPLICVFGIWLPADRALVTAREEHAAATALAARIRQHAPALAMAGAASAVSLTPDTLPPQLQSLAGINGLAIERMDKDGEGMRLVFASAPAGGVHSFLGACRQQGIRISELQITRLADGSGSQVKLLATL